MREDLRQETKVSMSQSVCWPASWNQGNGGWYLGRFVYGLRFGYFDATGKRVEPIEDPFELN